MRKTQVKDHIEVGDSTAKKKGEDVAITPKRSWFRNQRKIKKVQPKAERRELENWVIGRDPEAGRRGEGVESKELGPKN